MLGNKKTTPATTHQPVLFLCCGSLSGEQAFLFRFILLFLDIPLEKLLNDADNGKRGRYHRIYESAGSSGGTWKKYRLFIANILQWSRHLFFTLQRPESNKFDMFTISGTLAAIYFVRSLELIS